MACLGQHWGQCRRGLGLLPLHAGQSVAGASVSIPAAVVGVGACAPRGDESGRGRDSNWRAAHSANAYRGKVPSGARARVEAWRKDLLVRLAAVVVWRLWVAGGTFLLA